MTENTTDAPTNEIPYGYCQCGCGQLAPIAKMTNRKYGHIKDRPVQFIKGHSSRKHLPLSARTEGMPAPWIEKHGLQYPYGYCQCGCGEKTDIAKWSHARSGYIKGEPKPYIHNHHGRRPTLERFWEKANKRGPDDCWEWHNLNHSGYGALSVNRKGMPAHRFSYELHFGPIPDGLFVCHKCDNRKCVNPNHLFLGTPQDNMDDMIQKGRQVVPRGEERVDAKLTKEQVLTIRKRFAQGEKNNDLAKEYGLGKSTVWSIIKRRTWKHIG